MTTDASILIREQGIRIQREMNKLVDKLWIGAILQVMRIAPAQMPTAGVGYDAKLRCITLYYSPEFMAKLSDVELQAVLLHEVAHITEMHIYLYQNESKKERKRLNFAMDLVINQAIDPERNRLPKFALQIEHFKDKDGNVFPPKQSIERYYDLLEDSKYDNPDAGEGEGEPQELDQHWWDDIDKKEAAEAVSDLLKRAQNHYEKKHNTKSKDLADHLDRYATIIRGVNFKEILLSALRAATPGTDIKLTWTRPSRRFGTTTKGKTFKPSPNVDIFGDTSGSMTIDEINDILTMMSSFMESGAKKVNLNLFHHSLYFQKPFKKGDKFKNEDLQSGGTDLSECFKHIEEEGSDLAVFITDGHYDMPYLPKTLNCKVFFIIKEGGREDHVLKHLGKTIIYKSERK